MLEFIHTADWHLGNSFCKFDRNTAKEMNKARFISVESIFIYAKKNNIPLICCAGDNLDSHLSHENNLYKLFDIIQKYPAIKVVMIAGNHDPLLPNSIYQRVDRSLFPQNLYFVFKKDDIIIFPYLNLKIFVSSIMEKNGNYNPLHWIKKEDIDQNMVNIGLAHGSIKIDKFGDNAFPIEPDFALKKKLDYLALGDWHSFKKINDFTYYPGVPESLQFGDNGFALKVSINNRGHVPQVECISGIRQYTWINIERSISDMQFEEFKSDFENVGEKEIKKISISGFLSAKYYKIYKSLLMMYKNKYYEIIDNVFIDPGDEEFLNSVDGFMKEVVKELIKMKNSDQQFNEILNNITPINREEIENESENISKNEIIDKALLKIYQYIEEKNK